ncbi:BRO family protein [Streptomyces sp. NPDC006553]|uniref:BRO family protein n=1 Tax=unclassified Streptomyces TaxID=2593676 RepID=UPI0022523207|nr:BRO family protein [Streptomyces sp. NBC_00233]MCX5227470.1 BRO family protein [Streptomyces sp. NBC_00233]
MDAIDIDDLVYAATGAPLRRLTAYDGTHWFPVVDVAKRLGYAGSREALRTVALPGTCLASARELAGDEEFSGRCGIRASTRMVSLQGLVQLVGACRRPEAGPFRAWTAEVIAAVQRYGGYGLEPSPVHSGFVLPPELVDVLVRLDGQFDERAVAYAEHTEYAELLRETRRSLSRVADSLERLSVPRQRAGAAVALTPQQLVESWAITGDLHTVASCLAPALVRGGVRYRAQDITRRTGLSGERVRDCVRLLIERGCIREVGGPDADGARFYVLP